MAAASKAKRAAGRKKRRKKTAQNSFAGEIILIVMLAVSILLLISDFGLGGLLGDTVSTCFFGVFGIASYVLPVFLFSCTAFWVSNKENLLAYKKIAASVLFFCFLCALLQLLIQGDTTSWEISQYYLYSSEGLGGGVVGGVICKGLCLAFGLLGAYIILITGLVIFLIVITQRSLLGFCRKLFFDTPKSPRPAKNKKRVETPVQGKN